MNYRELTKRLKKMGCEFVRQAPGSHEVWWNRHNQKFTVIPNHGGREIPKGTFHAILRQLNISLDEFHKGK